MNDSRLKSLGGRKWYNQRFDGSPKYLFDVAEAEVKIEARKPAGTEAQGTRLGFMEDGKADWYLDMADIERGSRVMIELAKKDPEISVHLMSKWRDDEQKFQSLFDRFPALDLIPLSDSELLQTFKEYEEAAINRFTSSAIIDHFALGTDTLIADMLRKEVGPLSRESEFTKIFSIATAPVHQSFINEAEANLLSIAMTDPTNEERLRKHARKFFWTKNNYITAQELTVDYFRKEIEVWRTSGADLAAQYEKLKQTPSENARAKQELFQKYHFSPLLCTLLKISEDFTHWQDERKKATYLNIHMGSKILGEMGRRRGVDAEAMKFLVPCEVEGMFTKGTPTQEMLHERMKRCAVIQWAANDATVLVGKDVDLLKEIVFGKSAKSTVQDFRGLSACTGRVVGPVKVIGSSKEIHKVQPGDILVAVMTRPDYVPAMRKAAAIVTNEGGITSHAAIVSRELGIPCIIGTKIATNVLHDGDMVEVNANHGVVTILNNK